MSKDAYWFPHDAGARNDPKVVRLRRVHGHAGVGVYWYVIEMLREANQDGYELELSSIEDLSYDGRFEPSFIDAMVEIGLFSKNKTHFWSDSLKRRMERMDAIRAKRAESGRLGGKAKAKSSNSKANAKQVPSKRASKALAKSSYNRTGQDRIEEEKRVRRAHPLPDDWEPNEKHREFAREHVININWELSKFRDWAASKGAKKKDWDAAFRNWLRRFVEGMNNGNGQRFTAAEQMRRRNEESLRRFAEESE